MSLLQLKTSTVDLTWLRVTRDGQTQALTETEGALLRYLVANAGRDVERGELETAVGRSSSGRAIDIAVARLRAKLGESDQPYHIRTVRGVGYRFVDGAEPTVAPVPVPTARRPVRIATGRLDLDRREFVDLAGQSHPLGKLDVDLLERLAPGAAVHRDELAREVWGRGQHGRSLSAALRRLRQRLGDDHDEPRIVLSLPGSVVRLARLEVDQSARTNLRPQRTPFVERPEVAELLQVLTGPSLERSLVTVRGPAGIGKTRLVYEVGLRLVEGEGEAEVWFCDLTCALAEQGLLRAIETALGIDQGPAADSAVRVGRVLARKPPGTVLILDNFDQVSRHASTVEQAMRQAPNVRFVATSRHALGLPSERCLDVGPLAVDAAARLFAARAPVPIDPADAGVRTLVQRLDCLPLAVELAAARAGEFRVDELTARLGDRLNWLVRPPVDAVSPHRSLRGALDWSWDLLADESRRAFAQCAVFARSFGLPLARDVLDLVDPRAALQELGERSLLDRDGEAWRMYEGVRDYAREKLLLLGQWDRTAQRHAEVCARRAEGAIGRLRDVGDLAALAELRALRDDLLAVTSRTQAVSPAARARAAIALVPLLQIDGPRVQIDALCAKALALGVGPEVDWALWLALGERSRLSSRWAEADERFGNALAAAERVGELPRAQVLRERSFAWVDAGRMAEAEPVLREVLEVFRRIGAEAYAVDVERYLAKRLLGPAPEAAALELESVRERLLRIGDPLRLYHLHRDLASLHVGRGELDSAEACITASMGWARDLNLRRGEYDGLWWLALLARQRADLVRAELLLVEARQGYEALGEDERARLMTRLRALVWVEGGKYEAAEQSLSAAYHEGTEGELFRSIDLANLAVVWHLQDRRDAAIQAFLRLEDQVPPGPIRAGVTLHLAAALADDGRVEEAEQRLRQADAIAPMGHLREVLGAVVALSIGGASALDAARGTLRGLREPGPRGAPGPARRDQDLNIACCVLERAIERRSGAQLRSETTRSDRVSRRGRR